MTTTRTGWVRVTAFAPCPACGKPDFCTISTDGLLCKCMRVPSERKRDDSEGRTFYLHSVPGLGAPTTPRRGRPMAAKLSKAELEAAVKQYRTAIGPKRLAAVSRELRVSEKSLQAYGIGLEETSDCISFPMYDGANNPVGIHLRIPDYKVRPGGNNKMSVKGSRNGLFIPSDYDDKPLPEGLLDDEAGPLLLLTPEGVTDCCAARDAGFRAIGRPSNNGGSDLLGDLLSRRGAGRQDVVVVGEREETHFMPDGTPYWPGIEGPIAVCERLMSKRVCGRLRFAMPPEGAGKDIREWLTSRNAPTAELSIVIHEAKDVTPGWLQAARNRLAKRKEAERRHPTAA